ncbi:unnamed protein product (macronuclear) [Paramecium tetraurelia]|uniref:Uncharacterized protein n=1 Tax=Paramecium tetraurelia TaxID=5888 RepID=A0D4F5_PARTE|nr:uncharacterized protein GSPATT00013388001 [Paramecium tetraurelia]CAK77922.1 unnamed protein product [Paramecium tetraurelia]|eukprot:XP_001445319.1 hypothetical protein (macronuclear) [Paramecium tetraurelia strain d4-2]
MQGPQSNDNYISLDTAASQSVGTEQAQISESRTNQGNTNNRKHPLRNANFDNTQTRADFILKVYIFLTMELAFTFLLVILGLYTNMQQWLVTTGQEESCYCAFGSFSQCGCTYISHYDSTWLFWVSIVFSLILHLILFCGNQRVRQKPWNFIILGLYILFFGFLVTNLCIIIAYEFGVGIVWQAIGITFGFVLALTAYSFKTKTSFTFGIGSIFLLTPTLVLMLILMGVYSQFALSIFLCTLLVVGQGFFLIWETKAIIGDGKLKLSIDDYVIGSLLLYGSIIQLLWRIMMLIIAIKERK